jgi:hypothetical protein
MSTFFQSQVWASNGWLRTLRMKKNGYYTYWEAIRQCPEAAIPRVKIYFYD